jgi:hypothetical protein
MKDCPSCGLCNPVEAVRCDCGYDFENRAVAAQQLEVRGRRNMAVGLVLIVAGGGVTMITYAIAWAIARSGGHRHSRHCLGRSYRRN